MANRSPLKAFRVVALGLLLAGLAAAAAPAAPADALLTGPDLLKALRQGGLVLYLRHGATQAGETDFWQGGGAWDRATLEDCTRQRNLTPAGREQAARMGAAIAALKVPWGRVLASPYCRTRETAQLAFGQAEVSWDLFCHVAAASREPAEGPRLVEALGALLGTPPAPGTNTALVGHGGNLVAVNGVLLAEGEAAVFRPGAGGTFTLVARIRPEGWAALLPPGWKVDSLKEHLQLRRLSRQLDRDPPAFSRFRGRVVRAGQP